VIAATRRLAAILAADVAGYSRLMGADEEGTHERLKAHLQELIDPKIAEHHGRTVKNTGDGFLAEFPSVVDAVRCAAEVQRGMAERNAEAPPEEQIQFRIGINLGDVIAEEHDIFGDGVNVAARLEALAEPGGICISRMVRDQIRDKLPYPFEDLGEQNVKNIARPVRVYALRPDGLPSGPATSALSTTSSSPLAAPRLSIVVLPFANLSSDPEQQYFTDGITDDLTTDLSRIPGSFVIARNTAFTYRGKPVDARQVGRELGVRYVLEGSVRRTANQVRVNVQLIDAESGAHVWADRFDTDCANLAEAQDEIIGRLAQSFNLELAKDVGLHIERERMADPDALDLVMRGRATVLQGPPSAARYEEALLFFERALEIDPRSVQAKLALGTVLAVRAADGWSSTRQQDLARAEQLLLEALEVDPNSVQARQGMGLLHREQHRLAEAKIEFEMAIALDGNSVIALRWLALTLTRLGEPEAGIPHLEKAIRLSPRGPSVAHNYRALAECHLLLGHVDQAIDLLRRARAENPQWWHIPHWLAGGLGLKGELDEARAVLAESIKLRPEINSLAQVRNYHFWSPQYWDLREKTVNLGLRKAGMPEE
jgi:TolB-like protein/class 3 adenylate cyclase/Tfp pilus assembly protein PilF